MRKIKEILIILIITSLMLLIAPISQAANLTIAFSKTDVNVGDTITVKVNGKELKGKVSISVSGNATLSQDTVSVDNSSASVQAKINGEGKIKITATPVDLIDTQTNEKYTNATAGTLDVSGNTATKSNNANLKNLGITPNDFKGFKSDITTYDVTIPENVDSIKIYAYAQDSKASISGVGSKELENGLNSFEVIVTAEDGTEKAYTINITKLGEASSTDEKEELKLTSISFKENSDLVLSPTFNSNTYEYNLEVKDNIEKIELSGTANIENAQVIIEGNENLAKTEDIITLTLKADGYEDVIYKINVTKSSSTENLIENVDLDNSNSRIKTIVIIAVAIFIIIAIIIIFLLRHKKDNKRLYSSYYDYYNDNNNSEEEAVDVLKEMDGKDRQEKTEKEDKTIEEKNIEEDIPQGYTAEIQQDYDYEENSKKKKHKGKHF